MNTKDYCVACCDFNLIKIVTFKNGEQYCSWECFKDMNNCISEIESIMKLICEHETIVYLPIDIALIDGRYHSILELSFNIYESVKNEELQFCLFDLMEFIEKF